MRQHKSSPTEKSRAERIKGQFLAEVLAVNDLCADEKQKTAMRGVIMGAADRLFYRLKREWRGDNRNGPRRDTGKP